MKKVVVWSIYTRIFHILLMIVLLATFLTPDVKRLLSWHVALGYTIGLLFALRIVWGFMDIKYSQFKDFNFKISDLKAYMLRVLGEKKEYIGHNPATSYAIVLMIGLSFLAVITGALTYGVKEGMGIFSLMNHTMFRDMKLFKEVHEFFANALMVVIGVHIAGVLLDKVVHKSPAFQSMIDGLKPSHEEGLTLTVFQKIFGIFWISISFFALVYLLMSPNNIFLADGNEKMDYAKSQPLFYKECISCHTLYSPFLLPARSWTAMMDNLDNHFGDDASLDAHATQSIKDFLVNNSAEFSTKEAALRMMNSIPKDKTLLAITSTSYWKSRHKEINNEVFKRADIAKPSNCKACHANIENGLLNNRDIKAL